jgi:hypothetical protein
LSESNGYIVILSQYTHDLLQITLSSTDGFDSTSQVGAACAKLHPTFVPTITAGPKRILFPPQRGLKRLTASQVILDDCRVGQMHGKPILKDGLAWDPGAMPVINHEAVETLSAAPFLLPIIYASLFPKGQPVGR